MKTINRRQGQKKQNPPVKPEKDIPAKPDKNPDPTKRRPGVNEPERNDPTRIEEPDKAEPNNPPPNKPGSPQKQFYLK